MKRRRLHWILAVVLLSLLASAATAAVIYWRHTVPLSQTSEVYRRYRDFPGVDAAFIRQMPINDTLRVDMTLLQARDSLAFANLLKSCGRSDEYIRDLYFPAMNETTRFVKMHPKGHPELPKDLDVKANNEMVAVFPIKKVVAIFHTVTEGDLDAVMDANFNKSVNI